MTVFLLVLMSSNRLKHVNLSENICLNCQGARSSMGFICKQMISSLTEMNHEITRKKKFSIAIKIKLLILFAKSQWNRCRHGMSSTFMTTNPSNIQSFIEIQNGIPFNINLELSEALTVQQWRFVSFYCFYLYLYDFYN